MTQIQKALLQLEETLVKEAKVLPISEINPPPPPPKGVRFKSQVQPECLLLNILA